MNNKAFTLIELLLGLAITAILGVCVYNAFWSGVKLDDKMRHIHESYMELLMADQVMTHDLENAVKLDFSGSYPDALIFEGRAGEFSFLTQTRHGIKHIRYYSGVPGENPEDVPMIGRVVNPAEEAGENMPVEFLIRQESSLADWLNEASNNTTTQIVSMNLQKGTFNCRYAPLVRNLHTAGEQALVYQDSWDQKQLPVAVSCSFVLKSNDHAQEGLMFKRDIFLSPVGIYHE